MGPVPRAALALAAVLAGGACTGTGSSEPAWGLGAKADGVCDPAAPLCWPTADARVMRRLQGYAIDVAAGAEGAERALERELSLARELAHKLSPDALEGLAAIGEGARAGGDPEALHQRLQSEVLGDLRPAYYAAHLIPAGRAAEHRLGGGKADAPANAASGGAGGDYTEGVRESLELLREAGPSGIAYAAIVELSGALDRDYEVLEASGFEPPEGLSREERLDDVIGGHQWAAGGVGLSSGLVSLIPIAGIPLSVPVETVGVLTVHIRMTLEIAAIYGWDIRRGTNLFTASMFLFSDGALGDVERELPPLPALHQVIRALADSLGLPLSTTVAVRLGGRTLAFLTRVLVERGAKAVAGAAAEEGGRAALGQVLGWASLGLAVLASGAVDYAVTEGIGRHVAVVARPWLVDLPLDGTRYLDEPERRACFFSALGAVARADGAVAEREARLYQALLAKPYDFGSGEWRKLSRAERRRLAAMLALGDGPEPGCAAARFEDERPLRKLTLLSHLYGAAVLDRELAAAEASIYRDLRDGLDGEGWLDGPEIERYQIDYVERTVRAAAEPAREAWPNAYAAEVRALPQSDVLPWMDAIPAEVEEDFRCGFKGDC